MKTRQFILATLFILADCRWLEAQQPAPVAPTYIQPSPVVIQPGPQPAAILPPGSTVVPLPSQTPGSIFGPPPSSPTLPPGAVITTPQPGAGFEQLPVPPNANTAPVIVGPGAPIPVAMTGPPNPISVPVVDDDLAWDQIADVVSDYFNITREQRARRGGDAFCEGRIDTAPLDGATWLEPHRGDSVGSFNRWESTFQSIRRRATVRVVPDANGYLVEVIVEKELEDLPKPERATAGAAVFRTDGSLPSSRLERVSRTHASPCWIPLGRDPALEQRMLAEIHARLNGITNGRAPLFGQ